MTEEREERLSRNQNRSVKNTYLSSSQKVLDVLIEARI